MTIHKISLQTNLEKKKIAIRTCLPHHYFHLLLSSKLWNLNMQEALFSVFRGINAGIEFHIYIYIYIYMLICRLMWFQRKKMAGIIDDPMYYYLL